MASGGTALPTGTHRDRPAHVHNLLNLPSTVGSHASEHRKSGCASVGSRKQALRADHCSFFERAKSTKTRCIDETVVLDRDSVPELSLLLQVQQDRMISKAPRNRGEDQNKSSFTMAMFLREWRLAVQTIHWFWRVHSGSVPSNAWRSITGPSAEATISGRRTQVTHTRHPRYTMMGAECPSEAEERSPSAFVCFVFSLHDGYRQISLRARTFVKSTRVQSHARRDYQTCSSLQRWST